MTIKYPAFHCKRILDSSIEIYDPRLVEAATLVLSLGRNAVLLNTVLKCEGYVGLVLLQEDTYLDFFLGLRVPILYHLCTFRFTTGKEIVPNIVLYPWINSRNMPLEYTSFTPFLFSILSRLCNFIDFEHIPQQNKMCVTILYICVSITNSIEVKEV